MVFLEVEHHDLSLHEKLFCDFCLFQAKIRVSNRFQKIWKKSRACAIFFQIGWYFLKWNMMTSRLTKKIFCDYWLFQAKIRVSNRLQKIWKKSRTCAIFFQIEWYFLKWNIMTSRLTKKYFVIFYCSRSRFVHQIDSNKSEKNHGHAWFFFRSDGICWSGPSWPPDSWKNILWFFLFRIKIRVPNRSKNLNKITSMRGTGLIQGVCVRFSSISINITTTSAESAVSRRFGWYNYCTPIGKTGCVNKHPLLPPVGSWPR